MTNLAAAVNAMNNLPMDARTSVYFKDGASGFRVHLDVPTGADPLALFEMVRKSMKKDFPDVPVPSVELKPTDRLVEYLASGEGLISPENYPVCNANERLSSTYGYAGFYPEESEAISTGLLHASRLVLRVSDRFNQYKLFVEYAPQKGKGQLNHLTEVIEELGASLTTE